MFKVFIDGEAGTTGLRIRERLENRDDIKLLSIDPELRKDLNERKKLINEADIVFLCLPDEAAIEAVELLENNHTKIIDASTAHRTNPLWAYGFPELGTDFLNKIKNNQLIANPGCYASGFMSIAYPLVKLGIVDKSYPFSCNAISGYSGAGKKGIAQYEDKDRSNEFDGPRLYAMGQMHKHLKEMQAIPGLTEKPLFNPYVCDFYSGMLVTIPLYVDKINGSLKAIDIHKALSEFYKDSKIVRVMPFNEKGTEDGFLSACHLSGKDYMEIYVAGCDDRISITSCLDNLGKGASGAAIECMNIALGINPEKGLEL